MGAIIRYPVLFVRAGLHVLAEVQRRERIRLVAEMAQTRELMPLLMKHRNGYRWTEADRKAIREDIAALLHISPYLILFVAPGGFFAMPVLAWWLDRRRHKRADEAKRAFVEYTSMQEGDTQPDASGQPQLPAGLILMQAQENDSHNAALNAER
jgi:hypothetical protein